MGTASFDEQVRAAAQFPVRGWDFSWSAGRIRTDPLPWDYSAVARSSLAGSRALLDVDTGDGEVLAALGELPPTTVATEGYAPNLLLARERLAPLGVQVRRSEGPVLPADDAEFDVVLNRHARLEAAETARVLRSGGRFVTQQVGGDNERELSTAFGVTERPAQWDLASAVERLEGAAFVVDDAREARPTVRYADIGAVILQLRMVAWQVPGFSVESHRQQLQDVYHAIERDGSFVTHAHRFLVTAHR